MNQCLSQSSVGIIYVCEKKPKKTFSTFRHLSSSDLCLQKREELGECVNLMEGRRALQRDLEWLDGLGRVQRDEV